MARSRRAYRVVGRVIQVIGLGVAIYGLVAGLIDVWNEPTFSRIAGGVVILAGVALSITAEAFLLLYAIEENTRETKQILERLGVTRSSVLGAAAEVAAAESTDGADAVEDEVAEQGGIVECPDCGCPVRAGKAKCPACGRQMTA
jgi:hypothetical protein